jgi:hypothetical protein
MHDYLMSQLAHDRRSDLHREAAESRLAATSRRRARTAVPPQPRGMRAQLRLFLGRGAI